jgi:UDP-2,3-diacylglucosamine hydrolase
MNLLFISDLHLDPNRYRLTEALLKFLDNEINRESYLFILGDLFDVWLGDDLSLSLHQEVIDAFAKLTCLGSQIHFISGNRDFLIGKEFSHATGIKILPEFYILEHQSKKILLLHGDALSTRDTDYQNFRRTVRDSGLKKSFLSKSRSERAFISQKYRDNSRSSTAEKPLDIMDVSEKEVLKSMHHYFCDMMIHGHTHLPDIHSYKTNRGFLKRVVLGDWHDHYYYLKWSLENSWEFIRKRI